MHIKGMRSIFLKTSHSPSPSPSLPPSSPPPTFSDSLMEENLETARSLITQWDSVSDSNQSSSNANITPLFTATRHEAKQYLSAVRNLQSAMQHLAAHNSSSDKLVQAQFLMQVAMKRLEREFYRMLADNRDCLDPDFVVSSRSSSTRSSVSHYDDEFSDDESRFPGDSISETERERISSVALADLKAIADCMISSGYGKECVNVYVVVRKSIVDEALNHLGVERLSFSRVQKMDWEVLELKIKYWLNAVKVAVNTLFYGERSLCDHVFGSARPEMKMKIAESCFAEICREGAMSLFGFPENVAKCKKTPEKIFRTLDLYEAISNNWPQIESIFSYESTSNIRSQAIASQAKLGEAVRAMLSDFESAIQKESSKTPAPGGAVHPLTRYVMNYVSLLADYDGVLADIVADWPQSPLPETYYPSPEGGGEENPSSSEISVRLAWLILVLLCKLDGKAQLYKDVALSYLFLANNMQYVVVKVRESSLGFLLGPDWLTKHESKVRDYVSKYERVGWSKVLSSLPENPTAEQARACLQSFNDAFLEECRKQSSWIASDPKLRDEIKVSIASKLVCRYREFYEKHWVGSEWVIGFSPDDLGNHLSDILYGVGRSDSDSVSSSSSSSSHRLNRPSS